MAEIVGGGTPSTNNSEYWDGDIDWYAPAEIGEQIYVDNSERKITKLGLEKSSAKMLPADKTVLFTSRAGIGKTAILRKSACTNQGFQSMVLNDDTNPYFVFSMTDMIKEKAERVASGSTFAEISGKMLGNLEFVFPSKVEQDQIGAYFEQLDNLITLHQREPCSCLVQIMKKQPMGNSVSLETFLKDFLNIDSNLRNDFFDSILMGLGVAQQGLSGGVPLTMRLQG